MLKREASRFAGTLLKIFLLLQLCSENGFADEIVEDGIGIKELETIKQIGAVETKKSSDFGDGKHYQMSQISESTRLAKIEKDVENIYKLIITDCEKSKKERGEMDEIKGRLTRIETVIFNHEVDVGMEINRRSRRDILVSTPLPCNSKVSCAFDFKDNKSNKTHQSEVSKSGPTSCTDLRKVGHGLSGYYPVKKGNKIALAFCKFNLLNVTETLVGNVDIKTRSIHFYVTRNDSFTNFPAVIPFQLERVNEGGAMDLTSGVFTAPVPGIYHFEFAAQKDGPGQNFQIRLQVNGEDIGVAETTHEGVQQGLLMVATLTATLRLKRNDTVRLLNWNNVLYDDHNHHTHFTGWLVEEELII